MGETLKKQILVKNIALFIIFFLIPIIFLSNYYVSNEVFFDADGIQFFTSKIFTINCLKSGEFPFWNKYIMNGMPYAADANGVFYPFNYLGLFFSLKNFIYIYFALHIAIGTYYTYKYFNLICENKLLPYFMALIYEFSIHIGGLRKGHITIICCIIYLPVILYFIEKYIRSKNTKDIIPVAIVMALQYMTGVQDALYTDLAVGFYTILNIVLSDNKDKILKYIKDALLLVFIYFVLIMAQFLPNVFLMLYNQSMGATGISFEYFKSYSISFIKLIQMIFPRFFGDILQAYGNMQSSEMDIELFLGCVLFCILFYSIMKYRKHKLVLISFILMILSFLYAANAHIPMLSEILFKIPIIGGFRCPARDLFIFIFFAYVCVAVSIDKLMVDDGLNDFINFIIKFLLFLIIVFGVISLNIIILNVTGIITDDYLMNSFSYFKSSIIPSLIAISIFAFMLYFVVKKVHYRNVIFMVLITVITVCEVWPYYKMTNPSDLDSIQTSSEVNETIKNNIGNYKYWLALPKIDGAYKGLYTQNSNISQGISTINAYTAFNNVGIYKLFSEGMDAQFNYSGLLTGSLNAGKNLYENNSMLSMLGVKYIEDPFNFIDDDGNIPIFTEENTVYYNESIVMPPASKDNVFCYFDNINLKNNTNYKIEFTAKCENSAVMAVDFYGENYDSTEQECEFTITDKPTNYSTILNTNTIPDNITTMVRTISSSGEQIEISNFKVYEESKTSTENSCYKPFIVNDNIRIFENTNAADILFVPKNIVHVNSNEDIYKNVSNYDFISNVYTTELENNSYGDLEYEINDINFTNNKITASVKFSDDGFINFSQNYFPGWKAYIDGEETKIFMVNGAIQGIEIPKGEHIIEFRYSFNIMLILGIISIMFLIIIILYYLGIFSKIRFGKRQIL